jgi:bifunctional non-homologous end joining protein LigD
VPAGDDWLHEPKLDGYRLQVAKQGSALRPYSRRGRDWGKRLPSWRTIYGASPSIPQCWTPSCAFLGPAGRLIFSDCSNLLLEVKGRELLVYAFDLLHLSTGRRGHR